MHSLVAGWRQRRGGNCLVGVGGGSLNWRPAAGSWPPRWQPFLHILGAAGHLPRTSPDGLAGAEATAIAAGRLRGRGLNGR